ncbi:MAG TPA: STAS domain-containing protein [Mycobacterium sp.]
MTTMTTTPPIMATRRAGLQLSAEWLNSTVVRISASGEIDASNTAEMLDYVLRRGANCRSLILDLSDVTFFAAAGFSALGTLDVRCSRASVSWMLVDGPAVSRVLSICDPERTLPRGIE